MENGRIFQIITMLFKICLILLLFFEHGSTRFEPQKRAIGKEELLKGMSQKFNLGRTNNLKEKENLASYTKKNENPTRKKSQPKTRNAKLTNKRKNKTNKARNKMERFFYKLTRKDKKKTMKLNYNNKFIDYDYNSYYRKKDGERTKECKKICTLFLPGVKPLLINLNNIIKKNTEKLTNTIHDYEELNTDNNCKKVYMIFVIPKSNKLKEKRDLEDIKRVIAKQYENTRKVHEVGDGDYSCGTKENSDIYYDNSANCQQWKPETTKPTTTHRPEMKIYTTKWRPVATTKRRHVSKTNKTPTNTTTTTTKTIIATTTEKPIYKKGSSEFTGKDLDAIAPPDWEEKAQSG